MKDLQAASRSGENDWQIQPHLEQPTPVLSLCRQKLSGNPNNNSKIPVSIYGSKWESHKL